MPKKKFSEIVSHAERSRGASEANFMVQSKHPCDLMCIVGRLATHHD
ncbi:MAG TPA: hypothetical protein VMH04_06035 [Candidatus Solibacter sp.]|nr:hypothetical protein [Candidatus Solibacter sp.]